MRLPLRPAALDRLRVTRAVDVLIVGGGINGAGLLRELALNRVDVLLVEKSDFAAGATSASSRMIHGGLRYLENGEFRLVRESLRERNRLLKNAPHAVKPLPTTIPIFSRWSGFANATAKFFDRTSKPSRRGAALVKIGLSLYDLFTARDRVLPTHSFADRAAALRTRPLLHPGIVCTATYYDAWIPFPGIGPRPAQASGDVPAPRGMSTRPNTRPLDETELGRILRVGACLGCHAPGTPVMTAALGDFTRTDARRGPRCQVPEWP